MSDDREFPPALAAIAEVDFPFHDGEGYDYEPWRAFVSAEETTEFLRDWTGNPELDGGVFRLFGRDGAGGFAALWLTRPGAPLDEQPVVYLGSEGEVAVLARDLPDFLWLLADGYGPSEVVHSPERASRPNAELREIAERFAPGRERAKDAIVTAAGEEFPGFEDYIDAMCR